MAEITVKYSSGEIIFEGTKADYAISAEYNELVVINEVDIKGSLPGTFRDTIMRKGYCDISHQKSNGKLAIKATEKQFDEFWSKCLMDERYFKVIGVNTYPAEGYNEAGKLIFKPNANGDVPNILFCG